MRLNRPKDTSSSFALLQICDVHACRCRKYRLCNLAEPCCFRGNGGARGKCVCRKRFAIRSKRLPKSVTRPSRFLPARMKTKFMPVGRPKKRGQTNRTARLANRRMRCLLHVPLQPTGGDKAGKQPSCLCRSAHGLWFSLPICLYKRCLPLCFLRSRLYVVHLP